MKLQLIGLFFILVSCKSYNDFVEQEYKLKEFSKQTFLLKENKPLLELSINNHQGVFLFDTGANISLIKDSIFLSKIINNQNLRKSRSLSNASGLRVNSYKIKIDEIKSPIFDSKKIFFSYFELKNKKMSNEECLNLKDLDKTVGIIGLDNFISSNKTVLFDFDNNSIEIFNENVSKFGFTEAVGEIQKLNGKIYVELILNDKKIKFLFDTGNSGGLFIKENEFENFIPDFEGEMMIGTFNGISNQKIKIYDNVTVKGFFNSKEKQTVTSFKPFATNTMGMKFLNKFNWLIDFKNKKIYFQRNKNNFELEKSEAKQHQVLNLNNKLVIGFKSIEFAKYNLNDEIISVNNTKVTPENICEMQNLLNSTDNWEVLNLDIKTKK